MSDPSANIQKLLRNSIQSIESVKKNLESYKDPNAQTLFQASKEAENKRLNRNVAYDDLIETLNSVQGKSILTAGEQSRIKRQIREFQDEYGLNISKEQRDTLTRKAIPLRVLLEEETNSSQPNLVSAIPEKERPSTFLSHNQLNEQSYKSARGRLSSALGTKNMVKVPRNENHNENLNETAGMQNPLAPNKNKAAFIARKKRQQTAKKSINTKTKTRRNKNKTRR